MCLLGVVGWEERRNGGRAFTGPGIKSSRRCLGEGAEEEESYVSL